MMMTRFREAEIVAPKEPRPAERVEIYATYEHIHSYMNCALSAAKRAANVYVWIYMRNTTRLPPEMI